jgi:hypothetical protein
VTAAAKASASTGKMTPNKNNTTMMTRKTRLSAGSRHHLTLTFAQRQTK